MEQAIYSGLITLAVVMILVLLGFIWRSFLLLRAVISGMREKAMQSKARDKAMEGRARYHDTNKNPGSVNNFTSMRESPAIAKVAALLMLTEATSKARTSTSAIGGRPENPPNLPLRLPEQGEDVAVVQIDMSGPSTPDQCL